MNLYVYLYFTINLYNYLLFNYVIKLHYIGLIVCVNRVCYVNQHYRRPHLALMVLIVAPMIISWHYYLHNTTSSLYVKLSELILNKVSSYILSKTCKSKT